jgi:hypothetical protein
MVRGKICCQKTFSDRKKPRARARAFPWDSLHTLQTHNHFFFFFPLWHGRGTKGIPTPTSLLLNICRRGAISPGNTWVSALPKPSPGEKPSGGFRGLLSVALARRTAHLPHVSQDGGKGWVKPHGSQVGTDVCARG